MSRWRTNPGDHQAGLTLIEVLVVVPLVLLLIGTIILAITALTGNSLFSQEKNNTAYSVQSALDNIETSIKYSTSFLTTTDTLTSPQGQDSAAVVGDANGSSAFTYDKPDDKYDTLILRSGATSDSPYNWKRELIYTGTGACNDLNPLYQYMSVFFVNTNTKTLYKRTIMPAAGALCKAPWQRNSCSTPTGATNCKVKDEKLLDNVDSLKVEYFPDTSSTLPTTPTNATVANITLVRSTKATGENIDYSGTVRATRINSPDINTGNTTAAPAVTASLNVHTINFSWPASGNATGYNVAYSKNGGASWTNGPQNTTSTSYSITGARKETITLRVQALTPTGDFYYTNASATLPRWNACPLQSGWANYNNGFVTAGFTKTSTGYVSVRGLVQGGATSHDAVICQLPVGFRPAERLTFPVIINPNVNGRVDVDEQGRIMVSTADSGWTSLDGILFPAADATGTNLAGVWESSGPNWQWWGTDGGLRNYATGRYFRDSSGRVFVSGVGRALNSNSNLSSNAILFGPNSLMASSKHNIFMGSPVAYQIASYSSYNGTTYALGISTSWIGFAQIYMSPGGNTMSPIALTANSSWQNYLQGYAEAGCNKGTDDVTIVEGMIKSGINEVALGSLSQCGSMSDGTQIFPGATVKSSVGITTSRIDVNAAGNIVPRTTDGTYWTSLSNIHFIAD